MKIFFAPLQGYTDHIFRRAHHDTAAGVEAYFAPFLRLDGGDARNKDLRDVLPANNSGTPLVPQIIANGRDEAGRLLDILQQMGHTRVDINIGCPFPLQTARGRGAALLADSGRLRDVMDECTSRTAMNISVKMRSGFTSTSEGVHTIELLEDYSLEFITIHPRLASQQYKGTPDIEAFAAMAERSRHRIVYNGDLTSTADIDAVAARFTGLHGVMIGRGLLARPTLATEWLEQAARDDASVLGTVMAMHDRVYDNAVGSLQGDQQVLQRMRAFWQYLKPLVDKKTYKQLMKSNSLRNYDKAWLSLR